MHDAEQNFGEMCAEYDVFFEIDARHGGQGMRDFNSSSKFQNHKLN